jgi:hypothetical protein
VYRLEQTIQDVNHLKVQLDDKKSEYDQLSLLYHKTRGDMTRKISKQQKEYEDKISFLLQQLRDAEVKLHESTSLLRSSLDKSRSSMIGKDLFIRPKTGGSMSGGNESITQSIIPSDAINPRESYDELSRKWTAERQRREQLEKRNGELIRELRSLRSHK